MRLFSLCEAMQWAHLPVAGGIYDQHPELLEQWKVIFEERGKYEQEKESNKGKSPPVPHNPKGF
jgi:hypothetical protein